MTPDWEAELARQKQLRQRKMSDKDRLANRDRQIARVRQQNLDLQAMKKKMLEESDIEERIKTVTEKLSKLGGVEDPKGISDRVLNKYFIMDDAESWTKDNIKDLTVEQRSRELLLRLGQAGYLNDEQYSTAMEMPETREEVIRSIVDDLTPADLVQHANIDTPDVRKFSRRLMDLLDDFWVKHLTEEQKAILSYYPDDYYQLAIVFGELYRRPDILEDEEAPEYVRDILQIDTMPAKDRDSIAGLLYTNIGRDKLLLNPRIDLVFDWISSTKERVQEREEKELEERLAVDRDREERGEARDYFPDLEYDTVISKRYSYTDEGRTYEEEQEHKKSLAEGSKRFIYGIEESFRPEIVSAWPKGSPQFQKYLQTLEREDTEIYYHVTPMSNLELISREGLVRGKPSSMSGFLGYRKRNGIYVIDHDDDAVQTLLKEAKRLKRNVTSWAILEVEIPSDCYMTVDPKMQSKAWIAFCDVPASGVKFIQEVPRADILLDSEGEFSR